MQLLSPHMSFGVISKLSFAKAIKKFVYNKAKNKYEEKSNICMKDDEKKRANKPLSNDTSNDVFDHVIESSEFQHEHPLKRLSQKLKRAVYARKL